MIQQKELGVRSKWERGRKGERGEKRKKRGREQGRVVSHVIIYTSTQKCG